MVARNYVEGPRRERRGAAPNASRPTHGEDDGAAAKMVWTRGTRRGGLGGETCDTVGAAWAATTRPAQETMDRSDLRGSACEGPDEGGHTRPATLEEINPCGGPRWSGTLTPGEEEDLRHS